MKGEIKILLILLTIIVILGLGIVSLFNIKILNNDNSVIIEPPEGKLAIIIKEDGVFDNQNIETQLYEFLTSIENDINLDNIGIKYFKGESLDGLDNYIEDLYYKDEVRHLIMIGRDLAWEGYEGWREYNSYIQSAFWHVNDELCYLEAREPDNQGKPPSSSEVRDIAISWIIAPDICYSDKTSDEINNIKRDIIADIISTYTHYHNNFQVTYNQFKESCLHIRDEESLLSFYEDDFNQAYQFDWILVMNTDYEKIWEEMKKGYLVIDYGTHGSKTQLMISQSESDIYTTVDEYNKFIKDNGLPALFIDAGACEADIFQRQCLQTDSGVNYCWPQVNICNGVWAYYSMPKKACNAFSTTSPFLGHVLRNYRTQSIIFGDITAHMI